MALTAMTSGKRPLGWGEGGAPNMFQTLIARIDYRDVISHAGGVSNDGVYQIFDIPPGTFITRCYFVVEDTWTSLASATMQITESTGTSVTMITSTNGAKGNLTVGSVISAPTGDGGDVLSDVAGHADNFDTSARTIDFTTGTAAWTAGVGVLIVEYGVVLQ